MRWYCWQVGQKVGQKVVKKSSKSWRIIKEPKKLQRSEKFAKDIGSEESLPKHRFSVNEELELPLKLWQFFELFLLGLEALSIPFLLRLLTKPKLMELLILCHVFLQREENLWAKNTQILYQLDGPLHQRFYLRSARFLSGISVLRCAPSIQHQDDLRTRCAHFSSAISILEMRSGRRHPSPGLMG